MGYDEIIHPLEYSASIENDEKKRKSMRLSEGEQSFIGVCFVFFSFLSRRGPFISSLRVTLPPVHVIDRSISSLSSFLSRRAIVDLIGEKRNHQRTHLHREKKEQR